ncbi:MAG TPA: ABC transporter ATP-binding protein [Microbacteriaceae bacterium]|nr:ABC transporter ATP-binding protein [Microbacteriaceae bacterium]
MGARGGRGGGLSSADVSRQKQLNEEAPEIENLGSRVAEIFSPYRKQLIIISVLVLITASFGVIPPLITQKVFDDALFPATGAPNIDLLILLVSLMIAVFLLSSAIGIGQTLMTARVGNKVMGDLRVKLFSHLQTMELGFFTRTKTGVIQSRLQNDVGGVSNVLTNTISNVVGNTVTVIAAFVAMLILSWELTLIALIILPVLVVAQRKIGQIRARIAGKTQESLAELSAITQEALSISGVLLAKTFSRQASETARYANENDNQIELQVRLTMSGQVFFALVQVFMSAVPAIVYLVSGLIIANATGTGFESAITAGTIVAFTTVQSRLLFPMMALMRIALDLQTSKALFARIFEYLDLVPQIVDAPTAINPARTGEMAGRIEFKNVVFKYADAQPEEHPTISGVSFVVKPGEFVAFVGASGSGKTTIGSLIPRLYDVTSGSILFSGTDVRELKHEGLMSQIGMVTQESYLFHATIAENLRYGREDASDEELEQAAKMANIHDTIVSFADGYDTVVGERGHRLSGGEKQRIAIARVLLKNPPVLILDEATSSLDTVSERIVQNALDGARAGRTTVAIAHRLSTIIDADKIYVVSSGRIVEQGNHSQLLEMNGEYAKLYAEQT